MASIRALGLQQLDQLHVPGRSRVGVDDAVLVQHQRGVRAEDLASHAEGVQHPVITALTRAAQGIDVVALVHGVRRLVLELVHHFDVVERIAVTLVDGLHPLADLRELLLGGQRRDPIRLLRPPEQDVEAEREAIVLGDGQRFVEVGPVELVTNGLDGAPFAGVLRA